jgi:hypothetical protein
MLDVGMAGIFNSDFPGVMIKTVMRPWPAPRLTWMRVPVLGIVVDL